MLLYLRYFLPIQKPEQITEPRKSHEQLIAHARTQQIPSDNDRRDEPGTRVAPVRDDLRPIIDDAKPGGPVSRFIERMLIAAVNANLPQRDSRQLLKLPAHSPPIHRARNDRREVCVMGILVKELREYFLRTTETFCVAALPVNGRIHVVPPLNGAPCECSGGKRFAGHEGQGQERICIGTQSPKRVMGLTLTMTRG